LLKWSIDIEQFSIEAVDIFYFAFVVDIGAIWNTVHIQLQEQINFNTKEFYQQKKRILKDDH
jgi:hypothetical protein